MKECRALAEDEIENFEDNVKMDTLDPTIFQHRYSFNDEGYIITSKMGLDEFYYVARIIEVESIG